MNDFESDHNYFNDILNLNVLFRTNEDKNEEVILENKAKIPKSTLNRMSCSSYILNKYFDCCLKPKKFCYCESAHLQSKLYKLVDEYFNMSLEMKNYETQFFRNEILKYLVLENEEIELFNRIPFIQGWKVIKNINKEIKNESIINKFTQ